MDCDLLDLGTLDYETAWSLQNRLAAEIARGERPNTLLLLEHPHTFTFGRSGKADHLIWSETELATRGMKVHWVDRGGDVTYHGPGQLVGYPIIRLPDSDHVGYVRKLEKVLILALARIGLASGQVEGKSGVWVQADIASRCPRCKATDRKKPAKIAAIGVKVDAQGITRHGFALNVNPEMAYFEGIIPCGISEYPVVCLADFIEAPASMEIIKSEVTRAFGEVLNFKIHQTSI
jgi:lipoyl(octanoyl) transferase